MRADDSVMQRDRRRAGLHLAARAASCPNPSISAPTARAFSPAAAISKATLTLTRGREAFVCQHIGDLSDAETFRFYEESARHLLRSARREAGSRRLRSASRLSLDALAEETGLPVLRVQHHAAHIAAIGAEHRRDGPLLGAALDGHGLGEDGGAWGGELLALDGRRLRAPRPSGAAARCRAATAPRASPGAWGWRRLPRSAVSMRRRSFSRHSPKPAPLAAICCGGRALRDDELGRLFDAAAALLGFALRQDFEGQAAMGWRRWSRAARAGGRLRLARWRRWISRRCSRISSMRGPTRARAPSCCTEP